MASFDGFVKAIRYRDEIRKQGGFSLLEVIIAILLLFLAILGFVPLYKYVNSNLIMNRTEIVAYNLAKNRIEAIKSVGWNSIGTCSWKIDPKTGNLILNNGAPIPMNGDPNGNFLQVRNVTQNGSPITQYDCDVNSGEVAAGNSAPIYYNMATRIQWLPDQSRGLSGGVITDYKDIQVEVKAIAGTKVLQDVVLSAKVSQEGEQGAVPGGNILVSARNGWNPNPGQPIPVGGIPIYLTDPAGNQWSQTTQIPSSNAQDLAEMPGDAFFAALTPYGTWTMNAQDLWENGKVKMMVMPGTGKTGMANQYALVEDTTTANLLVYVAQPCYLDLNFVDGVSGNPVTINGAVDTVTLHWPTQVGKADTLSSSFNGSSAGVTDFGESELWPAGAPAGAGCSGSYELTVNFPHNPPYTYNDYDSSRASDWNGKFDNPGELKTVTVHLVPCPKVTVYDSGNGVPINTAGAVTASLYLDTHTYSGGAWGGPVPGGDLKATGTNDSNGNVVFPNLPDNQPAPENPVDGDTYTTYRIEVSAPGYEPFNPVDDYFWVQDGYMMECQNGAQVKSKITPNNPLLPLIELTPNPPPS